MKFSIIQSDIKWENKIENIANFQKQISLIKDTDLIILPEMFTTGFTMKPQKVAETMDGETISWMKTISINKNSAICGSIIIEENGKYFNRFVWIEPDGKIMKYDKRHLFSYSGENEYYTKGNSKLIIDFKGFRICPLICYDLRFPVFSRNVESYDILIYVANWPKKRSYVWKNLLVARAIENQSYVVGVNRIGVDIDNVYDGHSLIVGPDGEIIEDLFKLGKTFTFEINKTEIESIRNSFSFLNDRDIFELKLT